MLWRKVSRGGIEEQWGGSWGGRREDGMAPGKVPLTPQGLYWQSLPFDLETKIQCGRFRSPPVSFHSLSEVAHIKNYWKVECLFAGGVECGGRSHLPVSGRGWPARSRETWFKCVYSLISNSVVQTVRGFIRSLGKCMEAFLVAGRHRRDGVNTEGPALRELTPEA